MIPVKERIADDVTVSRRKIAAEQHHELGDVASPVDREVVDRRRASNRGG